MKNIIKERDYILSYKNTNELEKNVPNTLSIQEIDKEKWINAVTESRKQISNGVLEKVVLARELRVKSTSPFEIESILEKLRKEQGSSYLYAFENNGTCFLGASPERLVKKEGETLLSTCLAGSTGRGLSSAQDKQLGEELLHDEKNLHEHKLVVNFIRNAMEQCCDTVKVPTSPALYKVRDIQHLYTPVVGKAKNGISLLKMVEYLHPTPALGGFPSKEAVQLIRERETFNRGWYAAPIGWMDDEGNGEFAVAIRSGIVRGKQASLFAGCGIVEDSDPIKEYEETNMKFRPMLSALGGTNSAK